MRFLLHISFVFFVLTGYAQQKSQKGRFSVNQAKGCAPLQIKINEHDNFGTVTRQYYYIKDGRISNKREHTYTKIGKYQIVQLVGKDGIDKLDTISVEVVQSTKPSIKIEKCEDFTVLVTNTDKNYNFLKVTSQGKTFDILPDKTLTLKFASSNLANIAVRGHYGSQASCQTYNFPINPSLNSDLPKIISSNIQEICKNNFRLSLKLSGVDSTADYQILYGEQAYYEGRISNNTLTVENIPFDRTLTHYCFRIAIKKPCSGRFFKSDLFCFLSDKNKLSPIGGVYSTHIDSGIFIYIKPIVKGNIIVYRKLENEAYKKIKTAKSSFIDPVKNQVRKITHRIDYIDSCNNEVLYSEEIHPPHIKYKQLEKNHYQINVFPEKNNFAKQKEEYQYQLGSPPASGSVSEDAKNFEVKLNLKNGSKRQYLFITADFPNGVKLKSNAIPLRYETVIHTPNAFTPNGDGINDTLMFFGLLENSPSELSIYNKSGNLIYQSKDASKGWDGMIGQEPATIGSYVYIIKFATPDGETQKQTGSFTIIKN